MKKILLCIILACCNILLMQAENKQYLGLQVGFTHPLTRLNAPTVGQEKALQTTAYNGLKVGFVYEAQEIQCFDYIHVPDWFGNSVVSYNSRSMEHI